VIIRSRSVVFDDIGPREGALKLAYVYIYSLLPYSLKRIPSSPFSKHANAIIEPDRPYPTLKRYQKQASHKIYLLHAAVSFFDKEGLLTGKSPDAVHALLPYAETWVVCQQVNFFSLIRLYLPNWHNKILKMNCW